MKKKLANALSIARKIAVTPAHGLRRNRPMPQTRSRTPRTRWIQPHAVTSRLKA